MAAVNKEPQLDPEDECVGWRCSIKTIETLRNAEEKKIRFKEPSFNKSGNEKYFFLLRLLDLYSVHVTSTGYIIKWYWSISTVQTHCFKVGHRDATLQLRVYFYGFQPVCPLPSAQHHQGIQYQIPPCQDHSTSNIWDVGASMKTQVNQLFVN